MDLGFISIKMVDKKKDDVGSSATPVVEKTTELNRHNKRIGRRWLILPSAGLMAVYAWYAIASFIFGHLINGLGSPVAVGIHNVSVVLYYIAIMAIIVGIPVGIFYLRKK